MSSGLYPSLSRGAPLFGAPARSHGAGVASEDDEVQLREQMQGHGLSSARGMRVSITSVKGPSAAGSAAPANRRGGRRRWMEGGQDDAPMSGDGAGGDGGGGGGDGGDDLIPAARMDMPGIGNTGHIVRMRRGEAWSKFLAYEGCCQVRRQPHSRPLRRLHARMRTHRHARVCQRRRAPRIRAAAWRPLDRCACVRAHAACQTLPSS